MYIFVCVLKRYISKFYWIIFLNVIIPDVCSFHVWTYSLFYYIIHIYTLYVVVFRVFLSGVAVVLHGGLKPQTSFWRLKGLMVSRANANYFGKNKRVFTKTQIGWFWSSAPGCLDEGGQIACVSWKLNIFPPKCNQQWGNLGEVCHQVSFGCFYTLIQRFL